MKKAFFTIIIFFISSLFIAVHSAELTNQKILFFLEVNSSYNKESLNDYLIETTGKTNSLLEWNADYLFREGITGGMQSGNLVLALSVNFPLPFECGKMYDSDWRTTGIKTNYSTSDLFAGFGCDTTFSIKYNFQLAQNKFCWYVSPVISVSNSFIKYQAKNTICWCGDIAHTHMDQNYSWDSQYAKKVKKYGIDFTNNITSLFCGLEGSIQIQNFTANVGTLASPFTYIFSIDHHLNKEEGHYYQMIQKAVFSVWDLYAGCGYLINQKNEILLSADYSFCPKIPGDFYYGYYKIDHIIADETSRFSFTKFSLTLSWRFIF